MIAIDSSSLIAYLEGASGDDVAAVEKVLSARQGVLPPVVLSELLSDPKLPKSVVDTLKEIPFLTLTEGYWERVGILRSKLISRRRKARLADALIAQVCLDHEVSLITRDRDFQHFAELGGLSVV